MNASAFRMVIPCILTMVIVAACSKREEPVAWSQRPLVEVGNQAGDVAFSIMIPHELTATREPDAVTFSAPGAPRIHVALHQGLPPRSVDEAVQRTAANAPDTVIIRQERIRRGHLVVHHGEDRQLVSATAYRQLADDSRGRRLQERFLVCTASAAPLSHGAGAGKSASTGSTDEAAVVMAATWVANICSSLALEKPPIERR